MTIFVSFFVCTFSTVTISGRHTSCAKGHIILGMCVYLERLWNCNRAIVCVCPWRPGSSPGHGCGNAPLSHSVQWGRWLTGRGWMGGGGSDGWMKKRNCCTVALPEKSARLNKRVERCGERCGERCANFHFVVNPSPSAFTWLQGFTWYHEFMSVYFVLWLFSDTCRCLTGQNVLNRIVLCVMCYLASENILLTRNTKMVEMLKVAGQHVEQLTLALASKLCYTASQSR